jgi:hypothetical protein
VPAGRAPPRRHALVEVRLAVGLVDGLGRLHPGRRSVMDVTITGEGVDVAIETRASLDDHLVDSWTWRERIPRP